MPPRCSLDARSAAIAVVAMLAVLVLGCGPAATPTGGTLNGASPAASPEFPLATGSPSPTVAGGDAPPDALLAAEGGDPVAGQLGTFVWFQTGTDSPWLPGAPLAVGAGEPLTVSLAPDVGIRAWAARFVPAAAGGPDGAMALGEGPGIPRFDAPGPGDWTVEVLVEFATGTGNARYFWRLEVL